MRCASSEISLLSRLRAVASPVSERVARRTAAIAAAALFLAPGPANAEPARAAPSTSVATPASVSLPSPFDGIGPDLADAFGGSNLLWYGGAFAATGVMALGGADQAIRVGVQRHLVVQAYADSAFYLGYALPATVAPVLYIAGLVTRDPTTAGAGSAALQALGMTVLATSVLKIATGRPYPLHGGDPHATDRLDHPEYAREFRPLQSFWPLLSWPSGHTSATVSVAAALTAYFPEQVWIPLIGYPLGVLIGAGMVDGDRHWASDVVAGLVVGHAIGSSVGNAFRRRMRHGSIARGSELEIVPLLKPGYCGITAAAIF